MFFSFAFAMGCVLLTALFLNEVFFKRGLSSFFMLLCVLLYGIPLTVGIFGTLSTTSVLIGAALALAASFASILVFKSKRIPALAGSNPTHGDLRAIKLDLLTLLALLPAFLAAGSIIEKMVKRAFLVLPLSEDVVSYHLPNIIRAIQTGTLWNNNGFYTIYPYGYELIYSWGLLFLRSEALVAGFHMFFAVLLIYFSTEILLKILKHAKAATPPAVIAATCTLNLLLLVCDRTTRPMMLDSGKNDLAVTVFAISSLSFLYDFLHRVEKPLWQRTCLLSISLGLLSSVKPTGMALTLLILLILAGHFLLSGKAAKVRNWLPLLGLGSGILLLAGFWYLKPLLIPYNKAILANGINASIRQRIFTRELYQLNYESLSLIGYTLVGLFGLIARKGFVRLLSFILLGMIGILAVTPFSAFGTYPHQPIQLRLLAGGSALAFLLVSFFASNAIHKIHEFFQGERALPLLKRYALGVLTALGFACILLQARIYHVTNDLPDFNPLYGVKTDAYRYLYEHAQGKRLYTVGYTLREFALFGRNFRNEVHYCKKQFPGTPEEWIQDLESSPYDYLVISTSRDYPVSPELVDKLEKTPFAQRRLKRVLKDEMAAIYEVLDSRSAPDSSL